MQIFTQVFSLGGTGSSCSYSAPVLETMMTLDRVRNMRDDEVYEPIIDERI